MKIARPKHHNTNRGPNGHNTGQLHLCTDTAEKGNCNWLYQLYTTTIVKKIEWLGADPAKKEKKSHIRLADKLILGVEPSH